MLSREAAAEQLKQYAAPTGTDGRPAEPNPGFLARVRADPIAEKLRAALAPDRVAASQADTRVLARALDELDTTKLTRVFGLMAPLLAEPLARWWVWAQSAPYQSGYARRGFRSSSPAASYETRVGGLRAIVNMSRQWPQDVSWFAHWLSHVTAQSSPPLTGLFASEIDAGNTALADTLTESAVGRHPVSGITRTGIAALLACAEPDRWGPVATMLANAGREEGLRSTVLEAADLAHPDAFARVLEVVVAEKMTRFAGTARAVSMWFGEGVDVRTPRLAATVERLRELSASAADRLASLDAAAAAATESGQALDTFLHLWVLALRDARQAVAVGAALLTGESAAPSAEVRRGAARLIAELGLLAGRNVLRGCLDDDDLGVFATALSAWPTRASARDATAAMPDETVEVLERRIGSLGKARDVDTGVLGTRLVKVSAAKAADAILVHRGWVQASPAVLAAASADGRRDAARVLAEDPAANRAALFGFMTDASFMVRTLAIGAIETLPEFSVDEITLLEGALRRKASDVRKAAVSLLARQSDEQLAGTVGRLAAGTPDQVRAARELAATSGVPLPGAVSDTRASAQTRPTVGIATHPNMDVPTALVPAVSERTPAITPDLGDLGRWERYQPGAKLVVTSLRAWLSEHADTEVTTPSGVELLMNLTWLPAGVTGGELPLPELLVPWWERTQPQLTDSGVEVLLVTLAVPTMRRGVPEEWAHSAARRVLGHIPAAKPEVPLLWNALRAVATTMMRPEWIDIGLDAAATVRAGMPVSAMLGPPAAMSVRGRSIERSTFGNVIGSDARDTFADPAALLPLASLSAAQLGRWWQLARYIDEPEGTLDLGDGPTVEYLPRTPWGTPAGPIRVFDQVWRRRPSLELLMRAAAAGHATRGDLIDALMTFDDDAAVRPDRQSPVGQVLPLLSRRRPPEWDFSTARAHSGDETSEGDAARATDDGHKPNVDVAELVELIRVEAVAGELARGDLPGPLTTYARSLRSISGIDSTVALLAALGRRPFTRGYAWTDSRESSLSHLIRIAFPAPDETAQQLSVALARGKVPIRRVVEFGVYAPQWAHLVEAHLGWHGFESAVWWVHAHSNDDSWNVDPDVREDWRNAVSQRTPLDAVDLTRGAADVAWHADVIASLGEDRFAQVLAAAKYASSSGGHKRAVLYADALAGRVAEAELLERVRTKRHRDSVRALGLLPVQHRTDPAVATRYELLTAFVASDKSSGSARRASETTAATIGIENLARSAGFADPARLTWAMEAAAVADLAVGPVTATDGSVSVTLSLDDTGAPHLDVTKNGRSMKTVPTSAGKDPAIATLKSRVTQLRAQAMRMRASLERSCVSGERFATADILDLLAHPVIAPMLRSLVLISEEGLVGFPTTTRSGPAASESMWLTDAEGKRVPVDGSALTIAHPVELLGTGQWPLLQHAAFVRQIKQPFRQLFRELYLATDAEASGLDGPGSRRWAGQQLESRRAGALFIARNWVADFEVGFGRTFHAETVTAWCLVQDAFGTPGEAEDATITEVIFTPVGRWEPIPLAHVAPRLFSETMRDLDLVVSVAHASGVDPETSESSVEVRARLVAETAQMLALTNVEVTGRHALISGTLGRYSVHLGSGQVHRLPGNAVCIVPVSGQHRGRVFLPFADDDPRTAEVISKVLLLARDDKISDPTILEQLT